MPLMVSFLSSMNNTFIKKEKLGGILQQRHLQPSDTVYRLYLQDFVIFSNGERKPVLKCWGYSDNYQTLRKRMLDIRETNLSYSSFSALFRTCAHYPFSFESD